MTDRLAELINAQARKRDSKREAEIRRLLKQIGEPERLKVLQGMREATVGGTYELAISLLSGNQARAFFGDLVASSDASSLEHALSYGEQKLSREALVADLRVAMTNRSELLAPLKYWRRALWEQVIADDERLLALSEVRSKKTRPRS